MYGLGDWQGEGGGLAQCDARVHIKQKKYEFVFLVFVFLGASMSTPHRTTVPYQKPFGQHIPNWIVFSVVERARLCLKLFATYFWSKWIGFNCCRINRFNIFFFSFCGIYFFGNENGYVRTIY